MDSDRHDRRRDDTPIMPVEIDLVRGAARKAANQFIILLFGLFMTFVTGFPALLWAGSHWAGNIEGELRHLNGTVNQVVVDFNTYKAEQRAVLGSLSAATSEISKTMGGVVASQEGFQSRLERLERNVDDHIQREP